MKRSVLLFAAVAAIAFLSTSCIKDFVCKCTSVSRPSENYNWTYPATTKTQAKASCENEQTDGRNSYTPDYTCELE